MAAEQARRDDWQRRTSLHVSRRGEALARPVSAVRHARHHKPSIITTTHGRASRGLGEDAERVEASGRPEKLFCSDD